MMARTRVLAGAAVVVVVALATQLLREKAPSVRKATATDIQAILSQDADAILQQISLARVEVSMPVDGKGPRVLVRVEPGKASEVPHSLIVDHDGDQVELDLEVSETYEEYRAQ